MEPVMKCPRCKKEPRVYSHNLTIEYKCCDLYAVGKTNWINQVIAYRQMIALEGLNQVVEIRESAL